MNLRLPKAKLVLSPLFLFDFDHDFRVFLRGQFHIFRAQPSLLGVIELGLIVQDSNGGKRGVGNSYRQNLPLIVDKEILFGKPAQVNGILRKAMVFRFLVGRIPFEGVKDLVSGEELGTTLDTKFVSGIVSKEGNIARNTITSPCI